MIVKNINPSKLQDEFLKANIIVSSFFNNRKDGEYIATEAKITFAENTDMDLVQQIIDAHDPTPLPPQPTTEERLKMAEETILFLLMGGM